MLVKGNSFFEIHSLHVSIRIDNEKKKNILFELCVVSIGKQKARNKLKMLNSKAAQH